MYVIKGTKQCTCYELDDKEESLLVVVEHPERNRENFVLRRERVNFFIHPRAISG